MKKKDISAAIAIEYNFTKVKALEIVTKIFTLIGEALQNDQEVSIAKFGKFHTATSKARKYFNIQTKTQHLHQGGKKNVKFSSWKILDNEKNND